MQLGYVKAQSHTALPPVLWEKIFRGNSTGNINANSITPSFNGGYILAGSIASGIGNDKTQASRGGTDFWLIAIDKNGNKQWDKTYGSHANDGLIKMLKVDDGFIVVGNSEGGATGDKTQANIGNNDIWILKLDQNGDKVWDKSIGGTGNDILQDMILTQDKHLLLAATSNSNTGADKTEASKGREDYWIVKANLNGDKIWDKTIGGSSIDRISAITETNTGEFVLAGNSYSNTSFDKSQDHLGQSDFWVVKTDQDGNKTWDKTIGSTGFEVLNDITSTNDGGFLLVGAAPDPYFVVGPQTWCVKIDEQGNKIWDKYLQNRIISSEANAIIQSLDGNFLVLSAHEDELGGNAYMIKINDQGDEIWKKEESGGGYLFSNQFRDAIQSTDGSYVVVGYNWSPLDEEPFGYWVLKVDSQLEPIKDRGVVFDSRRNVFLGLGAGTKTTNGIENTFVGNDAGRDHTYGSGNTFIGRAAGLSNINGFSNTFLGAFTGRNNTSGATNTFIGTQAGHDNTEGSGNVFLGYRAGFQEISSNKLYIANTDTENPLIYGDFAQSSLKINGDLEVTGNFSFDLEGITFDEQNNSFVGLGTGNSNSAGSGNTFLGSDAGVNNQEGDFNTFIGRSAGRAHLSGRKNTFLGVSTGREHKNGLNNTFLGMEAGYNNISGSGNVFLGYRAGFQEEGSNKLYVANDETSSPLIYGDFTHKIVNVNGSLGIGIENPERPIHLRARNAIFRIDRDRDDPGFAIVRYNSGFQDVWKSFYFYTRGDGPNDGKFIIADWGTHVAGPSSARLVIANEGNVGIGDFLGNDPSQKLTVAGNTLANTYLTNSDKRLKQQIKAIPNAMESLENIRGVSYTYDYKNKKFAEKNLPEGKNLGLIAQEVQKIYPELVVEDENGYLSVNYNGLIPVLIQALKEQNQRISALEQKLSSQNSSTKQSFNAPAKLYQNKPNPFDEITSISMYLPESTSSATLYIYNMQGQLLQSINIQDRGSTTVTIAGNTLSAGMYLYALIADNEEVDVKRMILR